MRQKEEASHLVATQMTVSPSQVEIFNFALAWYVLQAAVRQLLG